MRVALSAWTCAPATLVPENTRTVTVAESPGRIPALPASVGVVSVEEAGGAFRLTTGAVTSATPLIANVVSWL